jgi:hypothetical protein
MALPVRAVADFSVQSVLGALALSATSVGAVPVYPGGSSASRATFGAGVEAIFKVTVVCTQALEVSHTL